MKESYSHVVCCYGNGLNSCILGLILFYLICLFHLYEGHFKVVITTNKAILYSGLITSKVYPMAVQRYFNRVKHVFASMLMV